MGDLTKLPTGRRENGRCRQRGKGGPKKIAGGCRRGERAIVPAGPTMAPCRPKLRPLHAQAASHAQGCRLHPPRPRPPVRCPPATKPACRNSNSWWPSSNRASCRSTSCSPATSAARRCWRSAATGCRRSKTRSRCSTRAASRRGRPNDGSTDRARWDARAPGRLVRAASGARRERAVAMGRRRRAGAAGRRDALCGARRRQAAAARCWCWRPARRSAATHEAALARGLRGRTDPRLFAGARRPALHGQRRAAPRQAHGAREVRRGRGAAGRRCAAGAGLRTAHARRRRACAPAVQARAVPPAGARRRQPGHGGRPGHRPGQRRPRARRRRSCARCTA